MDANQFNSSWHVFVGHKENCLVCPPDPGKGKICYSRRKQLRGNTSECRTQESIWPIGCSNTISQDLLSEAVS